jgi:hypothetical protein
LAVLFSATLTPHPAIPPTHLPLGVFGMHLGQLLHPLHALSTSASFVSSSFPASYVYVSLQSSSFSSIVYFYASSFLTKLLLPSFYDASSSFSCNRRTTSAFSSFSFRAYSSIFFYVPYAAVLTSSTFVFAICHEVCSPWIVLATEAHLGMLSESSLIDLSTLS